MRRFLLVTKLLQRRLNITMEAYRAARIGGVRRGEMHAIYALHEDAQRVEDRGLREFRKWALLVQLRVRLDVIPMYCQVFFRACIRT